MKYRAICENHLYAKAYAKGKRAVTKTVTVYVLKDYRADRLMKENPEKRPINRIGITVSKKLGGAVQRNRAKRLLREAYRLTDRARNVKKGMLVVLVARQAILRMKTQDVMRDLAAAFDTLSMFGENEKTEESVGETL